MVCEVGFADREKSGALVVTTPGAAAAECAEPTTNVVASTDARKSSTNEVASRL
jgi:hypothetical protein